MAIKIDVTITGQNKLMASLDKLTTAINGLSELVKVLNSRFKNFGIDVRQASRELEHFNNVYKRVAKQVTPGGGGGGRPRKDKSFGDLFADTLLTSRIGGGALSPLVGRMFRTASSLFGGSGDFKEKISSFADAFVGKFGMAGGLLLQASLFLVTNIHKIIEGFGRLLEAIRQWTYSFGREAIIGGSTFNNSYSLRSIGSALGIDLLGRAKGIGQTIQTGPAASYAASIGIMPFGSPLGGDVDYVRKLKRITDNILNDTNEDRARRHAIMTGLEDLLVLRNTTTKGERIALGINSNGPMESSVNSYARLTIATNALSDKFKTLTSDALAPFASALADIITLMTPFIIVYNSITTKLLSSLKLLAQWIHLFVTKILKMKDDESNGALDRNTKAVNANTRIIRDHMEIMGGGSRLRGSSPDKVRYDQLNENYGRLKLGMF